MAHVCGSRRKEVPCWGQVPYETTDTEGRQGERLERKWFLILTAQSLSWQMQLLHSLCPSTLHPLSLGSTPQLSLSLPSACSPSPSPFWEEPCGSVLVTERHLTNYVPGTAGRENGCCSPTVTLDWQSHKGPEFSHRKHQSDVQTGSYMHITLKAR